LKVKSNESLAQHNTFGIDATADTLITCESDEDLLAAIDHAHQHESEILILGGGSNVLFLGNVHRTVIYVHNKGISFKDLDEDHVLVSANSGENWNGLVSLATNKGLGGIENLALIPGNVGAAPIQNIGAYGVEIKDVFHSLDAISLQNGESQSFKNTDCKFGYRESVFKGELKNKFLITRVNLLLNKKPRINISYGAINKTLTLNGIKKPSIRDVRDAVIKIRQAKLPEPTDLGNAGSFFKNPVVPTSQFEEIKHIDQNCPGYTLPDGRTKIPAAWLIEQCGWKGHREGPVGVHNLQPLVLVNYGGTSGLEILNLANKIAASVLEKFGIGLEREVTVISKEPKL